MIRLSRVHEGIAVMEHINTNQMIEFRRPSIGLFGSLVQSMLCGFMDATYPGNKRSCTFFREPWLFPLDITGQAKFFSIVKAWKSIFYIDCMVYTLLRLALLNKIVTVHFFLVWNVRSTTVTCWDRLFLFPHMS